jgi:capsule polysaccharide export protein KpsE/RkpR
MLTALSGKTGSGGWAGVAGDLLGVGGSGATFVGIMGSETVQDRLVQRFNLKHVYKDRLDEDARKDLAARTDLAEERRSGIIAISVTDRDPHRASEIAQAYVEELNRLSAELSTSAAHRERVFLEERLYGVKRDLDQAAADLSQFSSKNSAIDIKEQAKVMVGAAAQLQGDLIAAESQRKALEAVYASTNPRVRSIDARIAELQKQLDKIGGTGAENGFQKSAGALYPSISQLPLLEVKYSDLYRRAKIEEAVYEALTQQYELAKVQEAKETPVVKVLDRARVPERRSFPPRQNITLLFAALGLAAGAVWLVGRTSWKQIEPMNPRKLFVEEVLRSMQPHLPVRQYKASGRQSVVHHLWKHFVPSRDH